MAPQTPQRHTSIIDLENGFSDGGSEYWPEVSNYVFKPNDDYYHRSLASQWMDSTGQSRKGTSPVLVFCKHTLISYHITFIKRCSEICSRKSVAFTLLIEPMSVLCTVLSVIQSHTNSLPPALLKLGQPLARLLLAAY